MQLKTYIMQGFCIAGVQEGTPNGVLEMKTYGLLLILVYVQHYRGSVPTTRSLHSRDHRFGFWRWGVDWPGGARDNVWVKRTTPAPIQIRTRRRCPKVAEVSAVGFKFGRICTSARESNDFPLERASSSASISKRRSTAPSQNQLAATSPGCWPVLNPYNRFGRTWRC